MKKFVSVISALLVFAATGSAQEIKFDTEIVTNSVALHPMIFDVDGDGKNDIVVVDDYVDEKGNDALNTKTVVWFSGTGERGGGGFRETVIAELNYRSCGIAYADLDNDGYLDIIGRDDIDGNDMNETGNIFWLRNPYGDKKYTGGPWKKSDIGFSTYAKDIVTADFNKDGKLDVVARGVDGFLRIYVQAAKGKWNVIKIEVPHHDGTDVADIDQDGDMDIVINGMWLEAPADIFNETWKKHDYASRWYKQKTGPKGAWFDNNTKVKVKDIDDDGYPDIFISNAENTGYAICWYKNPAGNYSQEWKEHVIGYMNFAHTLEVEDMDSDGDLDVVTGSLIIWNAPDPEGFHPVAIFRNRGNNLEWEKQIISEKACYGGVVGDVDNDGDLDIVAPRNWNKAPLYLWRNRLEEKLDVSKIKITEVVEQGMPCFRIETPAATYIYDRAGGGFVSMIDQEGKDWISFKKGDYPPPGNAASEYRGIPNLGIGGEDEGGGHPGFDRCETRVVAPNVIETVTRSGKWKFRWAFYNDHAKFTMVEKHPDLPYWFLYEGTPAGKYDPERMYWGNNLDGRRQDFPDLLDGTGIFNNVDWVYVGQTGYSRILYLRQVQPDEKVDLFSYMGNTKGGSKKSPDGMVCFGFGRAHGTKRILEDVNLEFVIGFVDREITTPTDHQQVASIIESVR